jgi:hypothetical protein
MAQTQTSSVPGYVKGPTKDALKDIKSWLGSDQNYVYGSKKGENLFTGMNDAQTGALGNVDWLADQDLNEMFGLNKASGLWDDYAGAGPELANKQGFDYKVTQGLGEAGALDENAYGRAAGTLSTKGIMDESGPLGAISTYINPYLEQVLNPQIREIQEESERQRRSIGAGAAMAGAFGDARHGIMEGENFEKTNQAVADTTGKTTADAFLSAMSQRQADMGRFDQMGVQDALLTENAQGRKLTAGQSNQAMRENALRRSLEADVQSGQFGLAGRQMDQQVELANQGARQNATERLATAAQAAQGIGNNSLSNFMDVNDSLMNAGNFAQTQEEAKRQTMQRFQEALATKDYNSAIRLLQAVNGAPKEGVVTTESTDGLFGILGSVLGGLF